MNSNTQHGGTSHGLPQERRKVPYRRIRAVIIGAGVSGILMAYKLRNYLGEYVDFQILEKSPELGGTWFENRYPGCACDVPSHCYQYSFAPNPDWSKFYASSQEIKAYLDGVATHFDLKRFIKFNTKVTNAQWSEDTSTWTVRVENGSTYEAEVLFNAGGILNNLQMPNITGINTFAGPILHTADWDSSVDLRGKRIGVVGAGASAVQLLPQIQPTATKVTAFIRTPSWISPPVALPEADRPSYSYDDGEKTRFRENDAEYLEDRKRLEAQFNGMFDAFFKASPQQRDLRERFESRMRSLIRDVALQERLIPKFEAGCRRINPGEQYLLTLQEPNVEPVFESIEKITATGIVAGGVEYPVDVLIAATGFNTTFRPRFPIIGRDGKNLQEVWSESPTSYCGTGVSGFPNYMIFLGPNTPISNGSLMGPIEATGDYFVRILTKMIRQRIKSFDVRIEAQTDFDNHTQEFMRQAVWTGTCRSWFKKDVNGKVSALWCGSSLHYMQSLAEDRWEDYEWRFDGNRYAYWGNGFSWIEKPELDPIGIDEREYSKTMTTIAQRSSDLSFYLGKADPLPKGVLAHVVDAEAQCQHIVGQAEVHGADLTKSDVKDADVTEQEMRSGLESYVPAIAVGV
ncbi:FAD-binding monooxygenase [Colletotrichum fructicola]|uniref:FAD-binding monooxygenase moxY n=1 Tax=Colletotrichum fructicola (strain Nara gc5) TaxID=1213859 RepID=A0A7J6JRV9_COLFN|nr:FAD-binding monooxygenase [Colletotrichum fructicola]KAE9570397.1 FAD-binding monooxygenase [Colletotrichum fructicola]KAF4413869.1 FAD-binding monooxygenase moxY [Colletotrichum fructicola]KAF4492472.1 FAD-binding monooxygenase moxY [Colletotrichum fructicola Nara gc5]KAF4897767.1 FAD-binding monooxygenase moxY [Colletotrichum fructicola]